MKKLELIYVGLREMQGEKFSHMFLLGDRKLFWSKVKYCVIGGVYEAEQEGESITMQNAPKALRYLFKKDIKEEWIDQDLIARTARTQRREDAKARRIAGAHWTELAPLHERCKRLNYYEKQAYAKAIARLVLTGKTGSE